MSKKVERVEIGKTHTGLRIVKVMVAHQNGRPAIEVETSKGHYVNRRKWDAENPDPNKVEQETDKTTASAPAAEPAAAAPEPAATA